MRRVHREVLGLVIGVVVRMRHAQRGYTEVRGFLQVVKAAPASGVRVSATSDTGLRCVPRQPLCMCIALSDRYTSV
jgi:hypothetical protein